MKGFVILLDAALSLTVAAVAVSSLVAGLQAPEVQRDYGELFSLLESAEASGLLFNCTAAAERGSVNGFGCDFPELVKKAGGKSFELYGYSSGFFRLAGQPSEGVAIRRILLNGLPPRSSGNVFVNSTYSLDSPVNLTVFAVFSRPENATLAVFNSTGHRLSWAVEPDYVYGDSAEFVVTVPPETLTDFYRVSVESTDGRELGWAVFTVSRPGMVVVYG